MREEKRGNWYLLTGLILGVALGLVYAWMIDPVEYVNAPPNALRQDYKDQYRTLIALAYQYNGDLGRAISRLETLEDEDVISAVEMQAQQALAQGRPEIEVQALGRLAMALRQDSTPLEAMDTPGTPEMVPSPTPVLPTATPVIASPTPTESPELTSSPVSTLHTPQPSNTPLPTLSPSPTPTVGAPFMLQDLIQVCNPSLEMPLLEVDVRDAADQPVPGVELVVIWSGGEEHFFTGLKPELGLGYADFEMTLGTVYALRLAEGGLPVENLLAMECETEDGTRYWGGWKAFFIQP